MINAVAPILMTLMSPVAGDAPAQQVDEKASDICVTVIHAWGATLAETANIRANPVPDSYRREYGWAGCQTLAKGNLIDWHLAFGDENSTGRALQFLTDTALGDMPTIAEFERDLPIAWDKAQEENGEGPSTKKLRRLIEVHSRFLFLAAEYLRAAEFFQSSALLAKSAGFLSPTQLGLKILYGDGRIALADEPESRGVAGLFSGNINVIRDLEMRYALTRAKISGLPADSEMAGDAIEQNFDKVVTDAIVPLFERGRDYCEASTASDDLMEACSSENGLSERLRSIWKNVALFELFSGRTVSSKPEAGFDSFDVAMKAIQVATLRGNDPKALRYDETTDDEVELLLARAAAKLHQFQASSSGGGKAQALQSAALDDLASAERLAPPAANPNRFRQIAEFYLRIYDNGVSFKSPMTPEMSRQAIYLREVLARLDTITAGASSPSRQN